MPSWTDLAHLGQHVADGELVAARHRRDGVLDVLAGDDEQRVDEVVELELRLAHQVPDGGGAAQAPHAVAGVVHAVVSFLRAGPGAARLRSSIFAPRARRRQAEGGVGRGGGARRAAAAAGGGAGGASGAASLRRQLQRRRDHARAPTRGRAGGRTAPASWRRGRAPWRSAWPSSRRRSSTCTWRRRRGPCPSPLTNSRSARVERRLSTSLALASRTQAELSPASRSQACSGQVDAAVKTRMSSAGAPLPSSSPLAVAVAVAGSWPATTGISTSFSSISSTRSCLTMLESVSVLRNTSL